MGRRQRLMSTGWRHGVVGVDDADSPTTQVFYQSQRNEKVASFQSKDSINKRRTKCKLLITIFPLQLLTGGPFVYEQSFLLEWARVSRWTWVHPTSSATAHSSRRDKQRKLSRFPTIGRAKAKFETPQSSSSTLINGCLYLRTTSIGSLRTVA